jgi:hypothetical protein
MTPEALYEQLHLEGFTFRADGDRLVVAPASRLTGRQQEAVRASRDGLLALARSGYDPAHQRRIDRAMAEYEPDFSTGPVQLVNLVLVDIFGRLVAVEAGEFEASLERLRRFQEELTMDYCRACGARVRWARTRSRKRMPLDAEPNPNGTIRLLPDGSVEVVGARKREGTAGPLFTSHLTTCPNPKRRRRRR